MQDSRQKFVELLVCKSCRHGTISFEDETRPGAHLADALRNAKLPTEISIKEVACFSNCSNGCSIVLRGENRWSYVYGNLHPEDDVETIIDGAKKYLNAADGIVPWRERSDHFRKNCVARIPPIEVEHD